MGREFEQPTSLNLPPGRFSGGCEYILEECPGCQKSNHCYYNIDENRGYCHSCKLVIKSGWHLKKLCGDTATSQVEIIKPWRDHSGAIFTFTKDFMPNAWDVPRAKKVLSSRLVTEYESREVGIMYLEELDCMICPTEPISPDLEEGCWYRALEGWPNKWIPRDETSTKYYGLGQRFIPKDRTNVLLVEGLYDILAPGLLGYAFTMFGTNLSDGWMRYIRKRSWIVNLWLDPDGPGKDAAKKMKQQFYDWQIPVGRDFIEDGFARETEPGDLDRWDGRIVEVKKLLKEMV